jgi:hypothetical protein
MTKGPKPFHSSNIGVRIEPLTRTLLESLAREEKRTISSMARILLVEAILVRLGDSPTKAKNTASELDAFSVKARKLLKMIERGEVVDPQELLSLRDRQEK